MLSVHGHGDNWVADPLIFSISRPRQVKVRGSAEWWLDRLLALYLHPIELYPQRGRLPDPKGTGNSPLLLCTYALVKERELRRYLEMLEAYWPEEKNSLCPGQ